MGTQATQCPYKDQLTSLPGSTISEQEQSSILLSQVPEEAKDEKGPLTSYSDPRRRPKYLLSQKRREWAACTSSMAAVRTSAGGSAQPPKRPWTKLWNARIPSSSPSVRLRRFSDCSPELCTTEWQVNSWQRPAPHQHPHGGWKLQPVWPPFTHQGPELFHPFQDELLVAQRPHS